MKKISVVILLSVVLTCCSVSKYTMYVINVNYMEFLNYEYNADTIDDNFFIPFITVKQREFKSDKILSVNNNYLQEGRLLEYFKNTMFLFRKKLHEKDFNYYGFTEEIYSNTFFYACGKIDIRDNIDSYLLLLKTMDTQFNLSDYFYTNLYLINYKDNTIRSIVELSCDMDGILSNSYLRNDSVFVSILRSAPIDIIGPDIFSLSEIIKKEYYIKTKQHKIFYYSSFIIDNDGHIKPFGVY